MKKVLIILLSLLLIIGLTACYSEKEIAEKDEWLSLGTDAMKEYLQEKYDISPKLDSPEVMKKWESSLQPYISADYIPVIAARFVVDGIEYQVCADVSNKNDIMCYDNYEAENIKHIILEYFNSLIGVDAEISDICFYERFENFGYIEKQFDLNDDYLVHEKINNIDDVLTLGRKNDTIFQCKFYYSGKKLDISDSELETLKRAGDFSFISLEKQFDAYCAAKSNSNILSILPNICDYIIISKGNVAIFDEDNVAEESGLIFYNENGLNVQTIVTEDEKTYFVNDDYYCYIPQACFPAVNSNDNVVIMGTNLNGNESVLYVFNNAIYELSEKYEKYYIFNNSNCNKDEYKYWYITTQNKQ